MHLYKHTHTLTYALYIFIAKTSPPTRILPDVRMPLKIKREIKKQRAKTKVEDRVPVYLISDGDCPSLHLEFLPFRVHHCDGIVPTTHTHGRIDSKNEK